ncbi:hypothetical protein QAD02_002965 [Eretmocerus hayati]|uniref:Uncharacterized protein n=2 Tax=Eretmocerus hayati TaxID=131215 RepID=A0ACC2NKS0_9HYME|nr:hypothetical protein QAD02_002958 [Eretmocerus hayati]KAJ8671706.1 hypothetical protein QAD02_002965 [Eretmocerus hayati]
MELVDLSLDPVQNLTNSTLLPEASTHLQVPSTSTSESSNCVESEDFHIIHGLNSTNLNQISQLQKTRGATLFALDIQRLESKTGGKNTVLRLCVAVKRKLQLYYWKRKKKAFEEFLSEEVAGSDMSRELTVQDIPRVLAYWCGETLGLGF